MSDKKYAVQVKNVKKSFFLPHHKNNSLKSAITQIFKSKDKGGKTFNALNGVSFNVEKGDFFGILGRNGSGKSTLLKIISEIYQPSNGNVTHDGKLVSFIELGVGFKAELTGRENVFLNGGLLGFSKEEVASMYNDIVEFAELEEFMDQKLKNYSSGMKVRLAFSVAIRAKADILILDEVLAVGDADFQRKCTDYFEEIKGDGKTVILVTHTMGHVRRFCNKAVVIEEGKVIYSGEAEQAADVYLNLFESNNKSKSSKSNVTNKNLSDVLLKKITISQNNKETDRIKFGDDFSFKIDVEAGKKYKNVKMGFYINDQKGNVRTIIGSKAFGDMHLKEGINTIYIDIENIFRDGEYNIHFAIENEDNNQLLVQKHKIAPFTIKGLYNTELPKSSPTYPKVKVEYKYGKAEE